MAILSLFIMTFGDFVRSLFSPLAFSNFFLIYAFALDQ